jgi:hypothetical protein
MLPPMGRENSDPPSGPTTPTPLHRNTPKRRAQFTPQKMPSVILAPAPSMPPALSVQQQVSAAADNQLLLLSDWKLALSVTRCTGEGGQSESYPGYTDVAY